MASGDGSVIMFVKAPRPGMVKSRLAGTVGDEAALALYMCFVQDTVRMLLESRYPFTVFFHPARSKEMIARWLGYDRKICPQRGSDLGERMKNAFGDVFSQGSTRAVLIGSDMPDLPHSFIDEAFTSLEDHDAVLGPSHDGGYYLIGFRSDSFLPEAFDRVPWSTPAVFQQTLGILQRSKYRVHTLQERRDIDTVDDLAAFFRDNLASSPARSATMEYVRSHIPDISRDPQHEHK